MSAVASPIQLEGLEPREAGRLAWKHLREHERIKALQPRERAHLEAAVRFFWTPEDGFFGSMSELGRVVSAKTSYGSGSRSSALRAMRRLRDAKIFSDPEPRTRPNGSQTSSRYLLDPSLLEGLVAEGESGVNQGVSNDQIPRVRVESESGVNHPDGYRLSLKATAKARTAKGGALSTTPPRLGKARRGKTRRAGLGASPDKGKRTGLCSAVAEAPASLSSKPNLDSDSFHDKGKGSHSEEDSSFDKANSSGFDLDRLSAWSEEQFGASIDDWHVDVLARAKRCGLSSRKVKALLEDVGAVYGPDQFVLAIEDALRDKVES